MPNGGNYRNSNTGIGVRKTDTVRAFTDRIVLPRQTMRNDRKKDGDDISVLFY